MANNRKKVKPTQNIQPIKQDFDIGVAIELDLNTKQRLVEMLFELEVEPKLSSFLAPIEWTIDAQSFKDYHKLIFQPMDLYTVKQKISFGNYSSIEEVISDLYLIHKNCIAYNDENSEIYMSAIYYKNYLDVLIGVFFPENEDILNDGFHPPRYVNQINKEEEKTKVKAKSKSKSKKNKMIVEEDEEVIDGGVNDKDDSDKLSLLKRLQMFITLCQVNSKNSETVTSSLSDNFSKEEIRKFFIEGEDSYLVNLKELNNEPGEKLLSLLREKLKEMKELYGDSGDENSIFDKPREEPMLIEKGEVKPSHKAKIKADEEKSENMIINDEEIAKTIYKDEFARTTRSKRRISKSLYYNY